MPPVEIVHAEAEVWSGEVSTSQVDSDSDDDHSVVATWVPVSTEETGLPGNADADNANQNNFVHKLMTPDTGINW